MRRWQLVIDDTGSVEGIYAFMYCTKWRSGQVLPMPYWLTDWLTDRLGKIELLSSLKSIRVELLWSNIFLLGKILHIGDRLLLVVQLPDDLVQVAQVGHCVLHESRQKSGFRAMDFLFQATLAKPSCPPRACCLPYVAKGSSTLVWTQTSWAT